MAPFVQRIRPNPAKLHRWASARVSNFPMPSRRAFQLGSNAWFVPKQVAQFEPAPDSVVSILWLLHGVFCGSGDVSGEFSTLS